MVLFLFVYLFMLTILLLVPFSLASVVWLNVGVHEHTHSGEKPPTCAHCSGQ